MREAFVNLIAHGKTRTQTPDRKRSWHLLTVRLVNNRDTPLRWISFMLSRLFANGLRVCMQTVFKYYVANRRSKRE